MTPIAVADESSNGILPARELIDAVVERRRASVDTIEEPGEVASAHLVRDVEEVLRLRMLELVAREVRGHDPLQRVPADQPLQRVQPQRRLAVRDRAAGDGPAGPGRR